MPSLDMNVPIIDPDVKADRKKILVDYFATNRFNHDFYAFKFFFCELLNFINVVGQIWLMDVFLGGEFTTYGSDVIAMTEISPENRMDPMSRVFPKVEPFAWYVFWLVQYHPLILLLKSINMILNTPVRISPNSTLTLWKRIFIEKEKEWTLKIL